MAIWSSDALFIKEIQLQLRTISRLFPILVASCRWRHM